MKIILKSHTASLRSCLHVSECNKAQWSAGWLYLEVWPTQLQQQILPLTNECSPAWDNLKSRPPGYWVCHVTQLDDDRRHGSIILTLKQGTLLLKLSFEAGYTTLWSLMLTALSKYSTLLKERHKPCILINYSAAGKSLLSRNSQARLLAVE